MKVATDLRRCLGVKVVLVLFLPYHITNRDQDARCPKHALVNISCTISLQQVGLEEFEVDQKAATRPTPHHPA